MNIVRTAAAGAGKTYGICKEAIEAAHKIADKRVLLITYTNRGHEAIINELKLQNHGIVPNNVTVLTWYQFLLRELIKPYQTYICKINEIVSIDYTFEHKKNFAKNGTRSRYITNAKNVRSEEASNLALLLDEKSNHEVITRLENCYSYIFIDEFQDLAGRDIDILKKLFCSTVNVVCVGDRKQATFQTHSTRTNRGKTGGNIYTFFNQLQTEGVIEICETLCSRRFNACICDFASPFSS